ncbi:hypothetical protein Hdeb2414_s0020g00552541 [Helianthus debilis subsp. tardiflorus]
MFCIFFFFVKYLEPKRFLYILAFPMKLRLRWVYCPSIDANIGLKLLSQIPSDNTGPMTHRIYNLLSPETQPSCPPNNLLPRRHYPKPNQYLLDTPILCPPIFLISNLSA